MSDSKSTEERTIITRFSSEWDGPRQFYLDTGEEVPIDSIKANVGRKPAAYDSEVSGKPWSFSFTFDIYYNIHQRIARVWVPSYWFGVFFVQIPIIKLHKLGKRLGL